MNLLEAILLGIVQGLTEFIPVSSSGHLVLLHEALGASTSDLAFDVALHVGTLTALLLFFAKDLSGLAKGLFVQNHQTRLSRLLALATVPAVIAGVLLESTAESAFRSPRLVAGMLLGFGVLMLLVEWWYKRQKQHQELGSIKTNQALGVGLAQALALVPGVSRSGSTITAGMVLGLDRVAATRFSFLLGIPIIAGAAVKKLVFDWSDIAAQVDPILFAAGMFSAFISGLFAIGFMLKFLSSNGLEVFAYYRIALGLVVLLTLSLWPV